MTSPSRAGRKTEATDNRLNYFYRAPVYLTSTFRGGRNNEPTDNRLDYFNIAHVYFN